jgi:outer membrane murein-binding lipoprotein Lpp
MELQGIPPDQHTRCLPPCGSVSLLHWTCSIRRNEMSTTQVGSLVISLEAGVARIQRDMDAVRSNVSSNMAAVRKDSTQAMQAIEQSSQRMAAQVDLSFGRAGNAVRGFIATYAGSRLADSPKKPRWLPRSTTPWAW